MQIYKWAILSGEEFMVLEKLVGEKFMIPCKNIHPCTYCFQGFLKINHFCKDGLPQRLAINQCGNSKEFGTVGFGDFALEVVDAGADQLFALVRI